ncbi:MAG: hypothetical protein JWP19_1570 [Rhodoglobus sp.]|nr:hypothetical protein [Rhodoglobus sp.]
MNTGNEARGETAGRSAALSASIRLLVREGSTLVFVTGIRSTRDSLELVAVVQRRGTSERR